MIFQRLVMAIKKALGWSDETKLTAANLDGVAGDHFGRSVASDADGSVVVVGSQLESSVASDAGAVYIYSGTDNSTITKLTGSDITTGDHYGTSVAVSDDGSIIVVGAESGNGNASTSGTVYVYSGANWATETKLEASDGVAEDYFGYDVAISSDGLTIVVGAYRDDDTANASGSVYVYNGTTWGTQTKLNASDAAANDNFGYSVDISDDASIIVVGTHGSESAYVLTGASWGAEQILTSSDGVASDYFGSSVSISGDGSVIAVGAYLDDDTFTDSGSVYIFSGASYVTETKLNASDVTSGDINFGVSVSLSDDGAMVAIGAIYYDPSATNSGAAYVYSGTLWTTETKLIASDGAAEDYFGGRVAISDDGASVIIGAYLDDNENGANSGAAYIYNGTNWADEKKLIARINTAGDEYGYATAISGDGTVAVVGAYKHNGDGSLRGTVYVYSGAGFGTETKLVASDGLDGDRFGMSVGVNNDGTVIIIGAPYVDGASTDRGAAYVYSGALWSTETKLTASNTGGYDTFGLSVASNNDGTILIVGAPVNTSNGSVYVYTGSSWVTEQILTASDGANGDRFGWSVSISDSGDEIAVGARSDDDTFNGSGSAYVFSGASYVTETKLTASDVTTNDDNFGYSIDISGDGSVVVVGAQLYEVSGVQDVGSVYVYSGTLWVTETKLIASDGAAYNHYGDSVSISTDGSIISVGSPSHTSVYSSDGATYIYSGTTWGTETKLIASDGSANDNLGISCSVSSNGKIIISGSIFDDDNGSGSGSAYVFEDI